LFGELSSRTILLQIDKYHFMIDSNQCPPVNGHFCTVRHSLSEA